MADEPMYEVPLSRLKELSEDAERAVSFERQAEELRKAALNVLRHFRDAEYGGGYAPLSRQEDVDNDVRALQNALARKLGVEG